jgi:hypothetical protein
MFARECRVAVAQARPVAREPNRTTVDLLVSSSPPPRPTAAMPPGAVPPAAGHGAADAERPRRKRGRGVLLGLAAVVAAVGLTIGVMQFLDEDEPDGRSAGEDPSGGPTSADATATDAATETASAEAPQGDAPPLPESSVLVNAETGECLTGDYDGTDEASTTWLDDCHDGSEGDYEFGYEFDAASDVRITYRFETSAGPEIRCMWWNGDELVFDAQCDVMAWQFTHLSTDEAEDADFWQIRAAGDGNYCLDVSDQANGDGFDFPVLNPCTVGDAGQQWRTAAL